MKKIFLSIITLALCVNVSAQDFSWGPRVSVSSPSLKLKDITNISSGSEAVQLLSDTDSKLGYQFGAFARVSLLGFYVQPELLFSNSNSELTFNIKDGEVEMDVVGEVKLNKIDIPVMIGKRFLKVVRVNAGPVFTMLLSEDVDQAGASDTFTDITTNYKKSTIGAQFGVGIDISVLTVDLRYELGLQSLADDISVGNTKFNTDQRMNQFLVSLGLKF